MTDPSLAAVRAAGILGASIAAIFQTGTAKFYDPNSATPTVPVLITPCRVKKPTPRAFDASNETEWSKSRRLMLKVPLVFPAPYAAVLVVEKGWAVQISTPDGDPTINEISFTVQSAIASQFAAERVIALETEINSTPRIV